MKILHIFDSFKSYKVKYYSNVKINKKVRILGPNSTDVHIFDKNLFEKRILARIEKI
jgi:hypothetical protein